MILGRMGLEKYIEKDIAAQGPEDACQIPALKIKQRLPLGLTKHGVLLRNCGPGCL